MSEKVLHGSHQSMNDLFDRWWAEYDDMLLYDNLNYCYSYIAAFVNDKI